ncbi:hypothetical protein NMY22_g15667 [Coprinellus aureogranulatus]|nr:hypothetical protein NMY22_g15667 [Coprinellus aureogranulatus]
MAAYEPEELVFLDETSKDRRAVGRRYGRSIKGSRAIVEQDFVRGRCVSLTGALTVDGIEAKTAVEGSMTRELYLEFLEHSVLPLCSAYPGPRSVLVMDNARIHHATKSWSCVTVLVRPVSIGFEHASWCFHAHTGVRIKYLPPYSPDLNPIGEAFSKIKLFLRRHSEYYLQSDDDGILYDMFEVAEIITPEDAKGYFKHAGYI